MTSLDNMTRKKLELVESYENYQDGEDAAIRFFRENNPDNAEWDDDMVSFYGPRKFRTYDEKNNITTETSVYECYMDSGSEDYFMFSYEIEL